MRSTVRRPARAVTTAVAGCAAGLLLLAGCGAGSVPQDEVEEQISSQLEEQLGQAPDSVDCPDDLPAEEGDTMTCTLTAGEDELDVEVTVDSVEDGTANFTAVVGDEIRPAE